MSRRVGELVGALGLCALGEIIHQINQFVMPTGKGHLCPVFPINNDRWNAIGLVSARHICGMSNHRVDTKGVEGIQNRLRVKTLLGDPVCHLFCGPEALSLLMDGLKVGVM